MFKFRATAKIYYVGYTESVPTKSNNMFQKRELMLVDSYDKDGETQYRYLKVEFTGERIGMLDGFEKDQLVMVEGFIASTVTDDGKVFNSLRGLSIKPYTPPLQPQIPTQQAQASTQQAQNPPQNGNPFGAQPQGASGYAQQTYSNNRAPY